LLLQEPQPCGTSGFNQGRTTLTDPSVSPERGEAISVFDLSNGTQDA